MKREGWQDDLLALFGRILALPMLQKEVKSSLVKKQDMDEARAIARLAEKPAETSAAGRFTYFGNWVGSSYMSAILRCRMIGGCKAPLIT